MHCQRDAGNADGIRYLDQPWPAPLDAGIWFTMLPRAAGSWFATPPRPIGS